MEAVYIGDELRTASAYKSSSGRWGERQGRAHRSEILTTAYRHATTALAPHLAIQIDFASGAVKALTMMSSRVEPGHESKMMARAGRPPLTRSGAESEFELESARSFMSLLTICRPNAPPLDIVCTSSPPCLRMLSLPNSALNHSAMGSILRCTVCGRAKKPAG